MAEGSSDNVATNAMAALKRLDAAQQAILVGVFVVVVGTIVLVGRMGGSTSMGILYSDLDPSAAAAVVDELESRGIPYELTDAGRVVWVPRQQVATTRLDMSSAGLPNSSEGWSILDNQGITSSEFDQRVGYQRAMEGELALTIAVIEGVESANVHLVIPEQDLFVDDETRASASVLLQTSSDSSVAPSQVQAIVNLVASSIEGLAVSDVTVTDDRGRLLAGGDDDQLAGVEADNQTRLRNGFESDIEDEVVALLDAVVGPGRSAVTVAADLDFNRVVTTAETYTEPVNALGATLPLSETTRLEQYGASGAQDSGALAIETEILFGVDPNADAAESDGYVLDERDVVYAIDSVKTSTETAPGAIKSMSVAVVIDETVLPAARVAEITEMVSAAVGATEERGDVIEVSLLPFDVSLEEQEAAALAAAVPVPVESNPMDMIRTAGAIAMGFIVLLAGVFMLRRASRRKVIDRIDLDALPTALDREEAQIGEGSPVTGELSPVRTDATESDLLELGSAEHLAGGVVGAVQQQQLGGRGERRGELVGVEREIAASQGDHSPGRTAHGDPRRVAVVVRLEGDDLVARPGERKECRGQRFRRSRRDQDLVLGIEDLAAMVAAVIGDRLAEDG